MTSSSLTSYSALGCRAQSTPEKMATWMWLSQCRLWATYIKSKLAFTSGISMEQMQNKIDRLSYSTDFRKVLSILAGMMHLGFLRKTRLIFGQSHPSIIGHLTCMEYSMAIIWLIWMLPSQMIDKLIQELSLALILGSLILLICNGRLMMTKIHTK